MVTAPIPAPNFNRDVPPPTNTERTPLSGLVQQRWSRQLNPHYYNEDNVKFVQDSSRLGMAQLLNAASGNPFTYKEAMESDSAQDWVDACQYEMDTLDKLKVWHLEPLPEGSKAVKSKWVFKKKADGRFRVRLVAKGFTQLNFDKTFSPVARFESLRLLLPLAMLEDWEIQQMDIKSAFLHGKLEEEIYMEQPIGFITAGKEHFKRLYMA